MLDTGYWMLDTGCWILDTGYYTHYPLPITHYPLLVEEGCYGHLFYLRVTATGWSCFLR